MMGRLLGIVLVLCACTSCVMVSPRTRGSLAVQDSIVSEHEFRMVRQSIAFLADGLLSRGATVATPLVIEHDDDHVVARFENLDVATLRLPDGTSLVPRGFFSNEPVAIGIEAGSGQVVLTGYLDRHADRNLEVRLIVDGSAFMGRFLFEMSLDLIDGTGSALINGVPYAST